MVPVESFRSQLGCVEGSDVDTLDDFVIHTNDSFTIYLLVSQKLDASLCPISFKWIGYVVFTYGNVIPIK